MTKDRTVTVNNQKKENRGNQSRGYFHQALETETRMVVRLVSLVLEFSVVVGCSVCSIGFLWLTSVLDLCFYFVVRCARYIIL